MLPDDLPFVTGSIGLLGTKPSWDMMMDCDTLLMVGSSFPYSEFLPEGGQARGVQIDLDGRMLGMRYPMEVNLVGDSAETLRALMPLLQRKTRPRLAREDRATGRRVVEVLETRAHERRRPDQSAARVLGALAAAARPRILTCDSGSAANWFARDLKIREGMMASLSGDLATMGPACRTRSRPSSPTPTGR